MKQLKLGLPKGIFVEDFGKLNISEKKAAGLLNFAPTKLYSDKDIIVSEKTVFFNEHSPFNHKNGNFFWDNIDTISDRNFETNFSATDFFLDTFLHEFAHAAHEDNLMNKYNGKRLVNLLQKCLSPQNIQNFQTKYKDLFSKICQYADTNPLDTVACDLSKRIIESLDKNLLVVQNNFIKNSPYRRFSLFGTPFDELQQKLREYWKGNFFE